MISFVCLFVCFLICFLYFVLIVFVVVVVFIFNQENFLKFFTNVQNMKDRSHLVPQSLHNFATSQGCMDYFLTVYDTCQLSGS